MPLRIGIFAGIGSVLLPFLAYQLAQSVPGPTVTSLPTGAMVAVIIEMVVFILGALLSIITACVGLACGDH